MSLSHYFSMVYVEQLEREIEIKIPNTHHFIKDITKKWGSSKITNNIFTYQSYNKIRFRLFFAVDIYYMVDRLIFWIENPRDPSNKNYKYIETNKNVLKKIKEGLETNTWLKDIFSPVVEKSRLDLTRLSNMVFTPKDYQDNFFNYYNTQLDRYQLKGTLLYAKPGTGKTFMSLCVSECLDIDYTIVISPNNALERVWGASLDINNPGCLFKAKQSFWISKSGLPYNNEKYIVVNYEYLAKLLDIAKRLPKSKVMIILDESHNLNEIVSQRTQLFMELCKITNSKNVILMSGTPIKALGGETIPLFASIDPYFTDAVMKQFKAIYGMSTNVAADILRYRLGKVTFVVEKEEIKLEPPIYRDIKITIPNGKEYTLPAIKEKMTKYIDERAAYYKSREKLDKDEFFRCIDEYKKTIHNAQQKKDLDQYLYNVTVVRAGANSGQLGIVNEYVQATNSFEKHIINTLSKEDKIIFKNVKTIYKYVNLKIQGECLGNILGKERVNCNVELAKHVDYSSIIDNAEKKTVIFTSFVEVLKECDSLLKKDKYKPITVYGETNKELNNLINQFDSNPSINPLVATYQSLSTAVPLTMADNMILLNQPFRDYILTQAVSRIHRLNADTQIYVYNILLDTGEDANISTRSADILKWSQDQIGLLLGLDATELKMDESFAGINVANEHYDYSENFTIEKPISNRLMNW